MRKDWRNECVLHHIALRAERGLELLNETRDPLCWICEGASPHRNDHVDAQRHAQLCLWGSRTLQYLIHPEVSSEVLV